jgi:PadR family transcriptional regulator PadR
MAKGDYLGEFEQLVLLAILHAGKDAYAVAICDEIVRRTDRDVSLGAVYATLERLEGKALVTSRLGEATKERGGRPKRFVEVTPQGVRALRESRKMVRGMLAGLSRRWGLE